MTIQIPNIGTGVPADQTGDSPWLAMKKVADNFSNTGHAASRFAGLAVDGLIESSNGRLVEFSSNSIGNSGVGGQAVELIGINHITAKDLIQKLIPKGSCVFRLFDSPNNPVTVPFAVNFFMKGGDNLGTYGNISINHITGELTITSGYNLGTVTPVVTRVYSTANTTKDANGFLKGASPVVDLYDNKIGLNHDAERQGGITFEKLDVGDYLIKGSLGFAQEGWYIETPKDANGNVLVAVVYEQLENNDLSIKTYAKRFDDETGDIVANLAKPRDIPNGRFISLRLHELQKEPPVMPTETSTEV